MLKEEKAISRALKRKKIKKTKILNGQKEKGKGRAGGRAIYIAHRGRLPGASFYGKSPNRE